MGRPKKVDDNVKFIQLIINKKVDLEDIMMNETYGDYLEYTDAYVDSGVVEAENVLEEEEFNFIKEVIKKYGK